MAKSDRPYTDRRALDTAILANASVPRDQRKTAKEIADQFGVPIQAVYDQANRLRKKGLMPRPKGRENALGTGDPIDRNKHGRAETGAAVDPEQLLNRVMSGEIVDAGERRRVLSIIIALGSDQNKLTAIKLLEEFEKSTEDIYGPKEPATAEEALRRLSRIMLAAGKEAVDAAYVATFGGPNAETAVEQTQN